MSSHAWTDVYANFGWNILRWNADTDRVEFGNIPNGVYRLGQYDEFKKKMLYFFDKVEEPAPDPIEGDDEYK